MFLHRITVSRNGKHLFTADLPSHVSAYDAREKYREIASRFTIGEGFMVTLDQTPNPTWRTIAQQGN